MKKEEIISALLNIADCLDAGEDAVDRYIYDGLENDVEALREAARMICEMQQCKHQWISAKDRLPRYNETVLVYRPSMAEKILADHYYGVYGEDDDEWHEGWAHYGTDAMGRNLITHWMPLPEPPKEVK